jgi:hypothetical protein
MPIIVPIAAGKEIEKKPEEEKKSKEEEVEEEYPLNFIETATFLRGACGHLGEGGMVEIDLSQRQILAQP